MSYPQPYGNYVLLERLGMGGMSEVDLARQRMGDRDFVRFLVIKRVKTDRSGDESFIRMFKDEARITSELHHANIGQVYDFGRQENEYYLALEYVPGIDVREIVNTLRERGQRVPVRIALRIIADVLSALDYAHTKRDAMGKSMGIVHRDVNPRNIMVSIHGETKLIDFGVAKAEGRLERTKTDHVKGKFSYMAPEQIKGEPMDGRADLFAVGLTLNELLAGYGPFYGLNQVQIVHRLLHGRLPEMPEVPDLADDSLLRELHDTSLARDQDQRYPNAAVMREELLKVAEQAGGLPSREQLAEFLQKVDPQLLERVQTKLEGYSGELDLTQAAPIVPQGALHETSFSGTIDRPLAADTTQTSTMISDRAAYAISAGIGGTALLLAGTVLLAVLVAILGIWWMSTSGPLPTGNVPVVAPVVVQPVEPPKPVEPAVVEPEPVVTPEPAVEPAPVASPKPEAPKPTVQPRVTTPKPPAIGLLDRRSVDPEPAPAPAPVVAPAPAPVPEPVAPAPEPEAAETGTVMVSSSPEKGLTIRVDGKVVGKTPLKFKLPAGSHDIKVEGYSSQSVNVIARQHVPVIFR